MSSITICLTACGKNSPRNNGAKDKANAAYHAKAGQLAQKSLESSGWTPEEKAAAANAIEEWLPKIVAVDLKEVRKKLKFSALRGQ